MWLTMGYFLLIYCYQLSVTYKTQDVGAYRVLFPLTVFTIICFSCIYLLIGKNVHFSKRSHWLFVFLPLVFASLFFAYHYVEQKRITSEYARSYDQRMRTLSNNKNCNSILELAPLSPSGMLYSAELSADTAYFANQHFKKGLRLNCAVRRKSNAQ